MGSDITRQTFNEKKHYRKVEMQQGRVQVDADWNEQIDIEDHHDTTSRHDIIGRCGGPIGNAGFKIQPIEPDKYCYKISSGNYYVDGILCENENDIESYKQIDVPSFTSFDTVHDLADDYRNNAIPITEGTYLAYLDVWQRHISSIDDPEILESALGGVDTATRVKNIWQVKLLSLPEQKKQKDNNNGNFGTNCYIDFDSWKKMVKGTNAKLQARLKPMMKNDDNDSCCLQVLGQGNGEYRGPENQLYRVEIHHGGLLKKEENPSKENPTFKFSRNNACIATKLKDISGNVLTVESRGRDLEQGFSAEQWVEVTDERHKLLGVPGIMVFLTNVIASDHQEGFEFTFDTDRITQTDLKKLTNENFPQDLNPQVIRWDSPSKNDEYPNGVHKVEYNSNSNGGYIQLEEGIEIRFPSHDDDCPKDGICYRTGDYWLIPARTTKRYIEWPLQPESDHPAALPPHGTKHHYCRLALLEYAQAPEDEKKAFINWDTFSQEPDQHKRLMDFLKQSFLPPVNDDRTPFKIEKKDKSITITDKNKTNTFSIILNDKRDKAILTWNNRTVYGFIVKDCRELYRGKISVISDCRELFPQLTQLTLPTTGIAIIDLGGKNKDCLFYGPFKHYLKVNTPPAIILGLTSSEFEFDSEKNQGHFYKNLEEFDENEIAKHVLFMEDYIQVAAPRRRPPPFMFKAVKVSTEHFYISLLGSSITDINNNKPREVQQEQKNQILKLRWWAIPSIDKNSQKGEAHKELLVVDEVNPKVGDTITIEILDPATTGEEHRDISKGKGTAKADKFLSKLQDLIVKSTHETKYPIGNEIGPNIGIFEVKMEISDKPDPRNQNSIKAKPGEWVKITYESETEVIKVTT